MKNAKLASITSAATQPQAVSHSFLIRLALATLAVLVLLLPVASHAQCCGGGGIGPQYPDFHDDSPSQNDPFLGPFVISFEDFTPSSTTTVTHVGWVGSFFNPPAEGPITGFTIGFYSDAGNAPGTLLYNLSLAGNANETFLQLDDHSQPTYQYGADINFTFLAGNQYWMSIVPDLANPPQWGWETSSQGDGQSYQCFFGACGVVHTDLAFWFDPQPTPEPGSLILLGSGVLGLGGFLRRRLLG